MEPSLLHGTSKKPSSLFHIGILVANLEASMKKFSNVLGIAFGPIQEITLHSDGVKSKKIVVKCAYSTQGPLHVELIEGNKKGPFGLNDGEGVHHLGVWSEEFVEYQQRKARKKLKPVVKLNIMPGDPTFWFSDPDDLNGLRIEFVNRRFKKGMEEWMTQTDEVE